MSKPVLVVLLAAVLAAFGWMFRWDISPVSSTNYSSGAYMVNRWTGEMRYLQGPEWMSIEERK